MARWNDLKKYWILRKIISIKQLCAFRTGGGIMKIHTKAGRSILKITKHYAITFRLVHSFL